MEEEELLSIKLVVIGDAGVGKTNLVARYLSSSEPGLAGPTIGVDLQSKVVSFEDGSRARVEFWDTAGMERYRSLALAHYRKADGAMIVYDLTSAPSFDNCRLWFEDLKTYAGEKVVAHMVGNKADLLRRDPALRRVPFEVANQFAVERGIRLSEVSALAELDTRVAFEDLLTEIKARKDPDPLARLSIDRIKKEDKPCCL
jgi:small GTP-binding protein